MYFGFFVAGHICFEVVVEGIKTEDVDKLKTYQQLSQDNATYG